MAVPSPGKCLVLFVLVLVLCTTYAFRIRDAIPSSTIETSRSGVCSGTGNAKCTRDELRTESSSTSLPAGTRRRLDVIESDGTRGRMGNKIRQPPVVDDASEDSTAQHDDDDDGGNVGKTYSSDKLDRWRASADKTIKFGRVVAKGNRNDEESEEDFVTEEDDDGELDEYEEDDDDDDDVEEIDADEDDDGVEISNGDASGEGTEEVTDEDDDEDDDDDDDDDDEQEKEEPEEEDVEDNQSEDKNKSDNEDVESEEDDVDTNTPVKKSIVRDATPALGKETVDRVSRKSTKERKMTVKEADGVDEETESENDDGSKQQRVVIKVSRQGKESGTAKKVDDGSKKKMVMKNDVQGSDEDEDEVDHDDDDQNDDEGKVVPASITPPPFRKLEKVRLADKEKSKSIETIQDIKPAITESEKSLKAKVITKSIEETGMKKKILTGEAAKATKIETDKSQSSTKPETNVKTDISSKSSKSAPSDVKSEIAKKSTTTKPVAKAKVEKNEKVTVAKTNDEGTVKKSEKSSVKLTPEVKKRSKKIDDGSGANKKNRTKSRKPTDTTISLTELNDAILRVPTFLPNFTAVEDPVCQQHGKIFLRQLRGYKLWALQMLDASAKIPSGLMRGNVNQLGDFDQCLGVTARVKFDEKTVKIQGKYCLATLDIQASLPDMKVPVNFMQSRGFIRGNMREPGHFIPRFTTADWAMCIPAACSAEDARGAIESALGHINISLGMRFNVDVDPEMCYVRQKSQTYTKETIGVLYFYAMIICVVFVATVRDYIIEPQGKGNYSERIIMSFSLRRTLKILTKEENTSTGEISCIHGIRSLATIALYVAHKMIPTSQVPYANRISFTEIANNPIGSLLRTSLAYTDCFLLLSGLLTALNMARESTKRGEIRWFCRFVARFIRLTPALLVMVFWYAYVMEHTGSGPQWHRVINKNADLCKQNSWTNLLYIQNFFPFEEMCATHTHQLALDMQLSLIAPILVFFLTLKPIIGILVVFFILQVSATVRYFATTNNYLSLVIFHGVSVKQLYKTANLTYILPLHRATSYVFGVGLGVLLHYTGKNVRIYRIFVIFGWLVATILGSWSLFSPWRMSRRDYVYDVEEAAHYAVIAPVTWSLALCWIIFACFTDHGGIVNKFLSSYWMVLFSRISYAVYLCQFAIFFYNVGTTRYSSEFQIHRLIDPYEAIVVTLVSVVLTLFIDIPMQEVKNVIMESTDGLTVPVIVEDVKTEVQEASNTEEMTVPLVEGLHEKEEGHKRSRSWDGRDDAIDGLTKLEDSEDEESVERWRPRSRSKEHGRSSMRHERYEDEDDEEIEEDEEELYDDERPTEYSWVKHTGRRSSVEDDGLVERQRTRSNQRGSSIEPETEIRQSSSRQYQREEDTRRERRSLSRQPDRSLLYEESPRNSLKRERSTSRASEPRSSHSEIENFSTSKHLARHESRGSLSGSREHERATTPSWETIRRERSPKRERSVSRASESRIMEMDDISRQYSRPESRASLSGREYESTVVPSWEASRHERSPSRAPMTPRREPARFLSSGSEEEPIEQQEPEKTTRKQAAEPKVSDEEDWEQELRIRRRKFMERLASEERDTRPDEGNDGWNSVKRRSSAEGKLALLKDPTGSNVMDSWTVSRGPRVSLLGSSQETEDDTSSLQSPKDRPEIKRETSLKEEDRSDEENSGLRSRRHSYTSGSQVTSLEEEEDIANNDFVLNKDSKRITVMDLSKLSQQEEFAEGPTVRRILKDDEGTDDQQPKMATLKLFKRESIVKSQASEEDPEYLLPERPKLMEQEQDHPFKKAWQLQKSRSEEDPSAYSLKEVKSQPESARIRTKANNNKENEDIKESTSGRGSSGPQSVFESWTEDNTDSMWENRSFDTEDRRSSSKSTTEDSSKLEWPSEDEQFDRYRLRRRRQSDDVNYEWELEET